VFISTFKWEARKGWDVLLGAYLAEFTAADNVELYILTKPFMDGGNFKERMRGWANKTFHARWVQAHSLRLSVAPAALGSPGQGCRRAAALLRASLPVADRLTGSMQVVACMAGSCWSAAAAPSASGVMDYCMWRRDASLLPSSRPGSLPAGAPTACGGHQCWRCSRPA
jgi:hypothetical protein